MELSGRKVTTASLMQLQQRLFTNAVRQATSIANQQQQRGLHNMKAVRVNEFGGPEVLSVESDLELPAIQQPTQVLVRVQAAGVNPVDTYIRAGRHVLRPKLPYTPGKDAAGLVLAVGNDVTHVKMGERVFGTGSPTGAYASHALFDGRCVWPLPDYLSMAQGAALGTPYATAQRALVKTRASKGESILVHGASGSVGIAACELAAALGLRVFGTASSDRGRHLAKQHGASYVYDHNQTHYIQQIIEESDGGVDVIIEMLSNVNLQRDLELMKPGGRTAIVGARGNIEISPRDLMTKETSVIGVALIHQKPEDWTALGDVFARCFAAQSINPPVRTEYRPDDVAQAHSDVIQQRGGAAGKLVIKFD